MQTADLVKKFDEVFDGKEKSNGAHLAKVANMLRELYPDGVQADQYEDFLGLASVMDKVSSVTSQDGAAKPKKSKSAPKERSEPGAPAEHASEVAS